MADAKQADIPQKESVSFYQRVRPYIRRGAAYTAAAAALVCGTSIYDGYITENTVKSDMQSKIDSLQADMESLKRGSESGFADRKSAILDKYMQNLRDDPLQDTKAMAEAYRDDLRSASVHFGQYDYDENEKEVARFKGMLDEKQKEFAVDIAQDTIKGAQANFSAFVQGHEKEVARVLYRDFLTDWEKHQLMKDMYRIVEDAAAEHEEYGIRAPDFQTFADSISAEWARMEASTPGYPAGEYGRFMTHEGQKDKTFRNDVEHLVSQFKANFQENVRLYINEQIHDIMEESETIRQNEAAELETSLCGREMDSVETLKIED